MRRNLVFILILLLVGFGAYQIGWYRGMAYDAFTSSLARGGIGIGAVWAMRKGNVPEALKLIEADLHGTEITLKLFKSQVSKQYTEALEKFEKSLLEYRRQFPTGNK